ncbi:MAG: nitrate reductase associated protein [Alphaproteobacteria bacterium]
MGLARPKPKSRKAMNDQQLFAFENDFVATLRCIPMAVRFKLDRCGIKLTLRQWSRLTQSDRTDLLIKKCHTAEDVDLYRQYLVDLVSNRSGEKTMDLPPQLDPIWKNISQTPNSIISFAKSINVDPLSDEEWDILTELQRFVLFKLSRDGHDNLNFGPALKEFGLGERV